MGSNVLLIQGIVFYAIAIGYVVLFTWWLYLSPLNASLVAGQPASASLKTKLACGVFIASAGANIGSYWDISKHTVTGEVVGGKDFLWPPHLLIYASYLALLGLAIWVVGQIALPNWRAGRRDPRLWLRQNPFLGAIALASSYALASLPGDALWHELFGIDLTAWSPPHISIATASVLPILGAVALLVQTRKDGRGREWRNWLMVTMLAFMLSNLAIAGMLDWELGIEGHLAADTVLARPVWAYPLATGLVTFAAVYLGRQLLTWRWTATLIAAVFFSYRFVAATIINNTGGISPMLPLFIFPGVLALDIYAHWARQNGRAGREIVAVSVFSLGIIAGSAWSLRSHPFGPMFDSVDYVIALLLTAVLCLVLAGGIRRLANAMTSTMPGVIAAQESAVAPAD